MDITGIDIAAVATLVGSIGTAATAVVKAVQAVRKAEAADARAIAIELQREQAKKDTLYLSTGLIASAYHGVAPNSFSLNIQATIFPSKYLSWTLLEPAIP